MAPISSEAAPIFRATVSAPVNIAVVKYWGKRSTALNLPTNSSLSVTLSQEHLRTLTTAACSPSFREDSLWLNGSLQDISGQRIQACFSQLRKLRKKKEMLNNVLPTLSSYCLRIVSKNNFPTAAGLASSAAGFAALVCAISELFELQISSTELSKIARQGSGSACRSLFGGFVAWECGTAADGSDSVAIQVAPESHWPSMRAAILVVSAEKKGISSTTGMQSTVTTSSLFMHRVNFVVPDRMERMKKAIACRDFTEFGALTMADSNSFHAVCLDTTPPILYLNDTSRAAIQVVQEMNRCAGQIVAAYTFDAGPNPVIYYDQCDETAVLGLLKSCLSAVPGWMPNHVNISAIVPDNFDVSYLDLLSQGVSRVILTGIGCGPLRNPMDQALIDAFGKPLHNSD